ncbi:hypothetical protein OZ411_19925, partial [Bradyrhizobium sp. Arg237L]|uniref:hypothetical protein n=1 Tax=Bradyrhizobium sp. Arg237L TaxID=3003352 RepID=UPI00249EA12B
IRRETRGVKSLICPTAKAEYFSLTVWTDFWVICPSGKFSQAQSVLRHKHALNSGAVARDSLW